nr:hypothetical protein Itr_chr14CG14000 [Ipomoea trifida]
MRLQFIQTAINIPRTREFDEVEIRHREDIRESEEDEAANLAPHQLPQLSVRQWEGQPAVKPSPEDPKPRSQPSTLAASRSCLNKTPRINNGVKKTV